MVSTLMPKSLTTCLPNGLNRGEGYINKISLGTEQIR